MKKQKNVKEVWLNMMLHFSAFINSYKLKLVGENGPKIILLGLFILLLELVNFFISLPAYAFIKPEFFAGSDQNAVKAYRLRRVVSLSVLGGMALAILLWIIVGIFGIALFPERSQAATASWDFNNSLAYHYDPTKIQIVDGAVIFKATQSPLEAPVDVDTNTPTEENLPANDTVPEAPLEESLNEPDTSIENPEPIPEPEAPEPEEVPAPVPEPAPAPDPVPAPSAPSSPLLWNILKTKEAYAQSNTCSATITPIAPLVVASFDRWTSFSEIVNKGSGDINYQLSTDGGLTWLYFNGSWVTAEDEYNTALDINENIDTLPTVISAEGVATLSFKAKFESDCTEDVTLLSLTADYEERVTEIPVTDTPGNTIETTITEEDPSIIAVTESVAVVDTSTTGETDITAPSIPVTPILDNTGITNDTSLDTDTVVETPTTNDNVLNVGQNVSLETDTTVSVPVAVPIPFSVHAVIATTGTPGRALYSIPGLFSLEEGPDNSLVVKVTGTDLEQTTLVSGGGASGNVSVGDHIIVLTYNGTSLRLYVDGSVTASVNAPIVIAPPAQVSTSIGCVSAGVILEALTLAEINANYIQCGNQAPVIDIERASQRADGSFVDIEYTITDQENNFVTLTKYEFSLTGEFEGEERTMTERTADETSDGTGGLSGSSSGVSHGFVWNAALDLPNTSSNVYVRMRGTDGLAASGNATFGPFLVDTKAPVVTDIQGEENDGGVVEVSYKVTDTSEPVQISVEVSNDSGETWTVPTAGATGALGQVINTSSTTVRTIAWNADQNLPAFEGNIKVRITATDAYGNQSVTESGSIAVDTRVPFGLANFEGISSNENEILWHWSPAGGESNFSHYMITYGTNIAEVTSSSGASIRTWGPTRDSDMNIIGTDRTVITGLTADTRYYAKITAYDDFGYESTSVVAFFDTKPNASAEAGTPVPATETDVNIGDIIVGGEEITATLPDTSALPPTLPTGGFKININSSDTSTASREVALALTAGEDTALMSISNHSDLADAALVPYESTAVWDLCEGLDVCENGTHTVYVKYYTSFGVGSVASKVSDSIVLSIPAVPVSAETDAGGQENTSSNSNEAVIESSNNSNTGSSSGGGSNRNLENESSNDRDKVSESASSVPTQSRGEEVATKIVPATETVPWNEPVIRNLSEARESGVLAKPAVDSVNKSIVGGSIAFEGQGIPGSKVALFIHSDQVVVYTTDVSPEGKWSYTHDQENVELSPGEHSVFAVTYDPGSRVKSRPSLVQTFEVNENMAAVILSYVDLPTTLLTLLACILGAAYIWSQKQRNNKFK